MAGAADIGLGGSAAVVDADPLRRLLAVAAAGAAGFRVVPAGRADVLFVGLDDGCPPLPSGPAPRVGYGVAHTAVLAAHRRHGCVDLVLALRALAGAPRFLHLPVDDPLVAAGVTRREADVLVLLLAGAGTAQVAATLGVSLATVRSHVRALLRRLGAADRRALRARLLGGPDLTGPALGPPDGLALHGPRALGPGRCPAGPDARFAEGCPLARRAAAATYSAGAQPPAAGARRPGDGAPPPAAAAHRRPARPPQGPRPEDDAQGVRMQARLQVLSREECEQVHERSLAVLAGTGVRVDSGAARALLAEAGAAVDEGSRRARLSPDLVEWSLGQAGRRFTLGGRRRDWSFAVNEGGFTLLADGGATAVLDDDTMAPRRPTHDDWAAATRLLDALDDVGLYWCPTEYPSDCERPEVFVRYLAEVFATFGKHVQESFGDPALAPWCREVLDTVFGGPEAVRERRPLSFLITPASPLVLEAGHVEAWLGLRDYGLPVALMPMPLQGATAPGSRLATLVTANCEVLAALCLVQVAAPGTPVLYAPVVATMEPRSGLYAAGAPEHAALGAAATDMARFYGLPAESSGLTTQTYAPDLQTAWEKGMSALLAVLAAPDVLVGPGLLGGATVLCLAQLVLDVEMVRWARRAASGVPVGDDLWLTDVLAAVGPGGTFLGEHSTRRNLRAGEWGPAGLGVRGSREAWQAAGAPATLAEARARVRELLSAHEPEPLPDDVRAALEALARRAAAG